MREIEIKVDATYGVKVKVGDNVSKGQEIGVSADKIVTCRSSGIVKDIRFEPANHEFTVVLES